MTYLQTHSRPYQRRSRYLAGFVIGIIVIAGSIQLFIPHFFPAIATSLVRPFWRTEFSILAGSLRSPESLLNENEELKRRLSEAELRIDTIRFVEMENDELKGILGRAAPVDPQSTTTPAQPDLAEGKILAAVLKHPPVTLYDEIVIDIGSDHGLSTTSRVYAPGNILIGRVSDVLGTTAKVMLFSSPGEKHNVYIGPSHALAVAIGRGGGQYEAQVAHDTSVAAGDFVVNPSLSDGPFGIVTEVLSDPTQLFNTILFAPPINIYELRWVLVDADL